MYSRVRRNTSQFGGRQDGFFFFSSKKKKGVDGVGRRRPRAVVRGLWPSGCRGHVRGSHRGHIRFFVNPRL